MARNGTLKNESMQGGCMTISSLGGLVGYFTPIINAPEVSILGLGRSEIKPFWDGEKFEPKLFLPLSLSYDHRVIDGAEGATFISELCKTLDEFENITQKKIILYFYLVGLLTQYTMGMFR